MEGSNKGDFPTGSSGGGGKRGYGVKTSFLFPRGEDESPPNAGGENSQNRDITRNNHNRLPANNEENLVDWIDGQGGGVEGLRINGRDENYDSTSSSSDQEFRRNSDRYDDGRDRIDDMEFGGRQGGFGYATYIGYTGFIGFPSVQGGYGIAGFIGTPVHGQGGLALRLNGSNALEYIRSGVGNNVSHSGVQGDHSANDPSMQAQANGGFGGMYGIRRDGNHNMNRINNGSIFYYATTTAYAYRRLNGDILSEMLSLRDSHIFNIINATEYAGAISQICNNADLAGAMINHLDCVKALLSRNLPLALSKQIACVNAVMKLLNEAYSMQEEWTFPVISTVTFDLRIISDRAASTGCRGRAIIRYDWAVNNVTCFFHPADCQCHEAKVYRTRKFYRRF